MAIKEDKQRVAFSLDNDVLEKLEEMKTKKNIHAPSWRRVTKSDIVTDLILKEYKEVMK